MTKIPLIPPASKRVEIVVFPGVQLLDVTGPLQVFTSANEYRRQVGQPPAYETAVVSSSRTVMSSAGLELVAQRLPPVDRPIDTLIVAGGPDVRAAVEDKRLLRWLAARARLARRVASVCTGAFLLGATGLLDGKRVVTHWRACDQLARLFPRARVEMDPIFIEDGLLWTSAGVTAGIDQSLAMVEMDIGHAAAMDVARDLVVFLKRPGGQAQFSTALRLQGRDCSFDRLNSWIVGHLAENLSVSRLAARAQLSERSFVRHYREAVGITPARSISKLRVEAARALLTTSRSPVKRIAERCGFGTEETMRRSFMRELGIAPRDFRARFSGAAIRA